MTLIIKKSGIPVLIIAGKSQRAVLFSASQIGWVNTRLHTWEWA
jgi:hypothetical protein